MAYDAFLKIDGIESESTDGKHEKWIEVLSFSWGVSQATSGSASSGGARSAERADMSDFSIVKSIDKASPKLKLACFKGDHIKEVTLEICRNSGDKLKYAEYKMSDVLVTSVQTGGSAQADEKLPVETVSFHPGKMEFTYTATDQKTGKGVGDVKMHWSVIENKGG
ncbi:MAG TPA: type VI secretion system tube protein Hcp [Myxococcota bacterium]|nr:type VI secretion system tube protein Hcp [Myxococcota bacterium]